MPLQKEKTQPPNPVIEGRKRFTRGWIKAIVKYNNCIFPLHCPCFFLSICQRRNLAFVSVD